MRTLSLRAFSAWDCTDAMTAAMHMSTAWSAHDMDTGSSRFLRAAWAAYKISHADTVDCLLPIPPLAGLTCAHGLMHDPCKDKWLVSASHPNQPRYLVVSS